MKVHCHQKIFCLPFKLSVNDCMIYYIIRSYMAILLLPFIIWSERAQDVQLRAPRTDLAPKSSLSAQLCPEVTAQLTCVPQFRHPCRGPQRYLLLFTKHLGSSALILRYRFVKSLTSENNLGRTIVTVKSQASHRIFKKFSTRDECGDVGWRGQNCKQNLIWRFTKLQASSNHF